MMTLLVWGMFGCQDDYPDEWLRWCGPDAEDGKPEDCEEPFVCVERPDVRSADSETRYRCSFPCESDADCDKRRGVPSDDCMDNGFCRDAVVSQ